MESSIKSHTCEEQIEEHVEIGGLQPYPCSLLYRTMSIVTNRIDMKSRVEQDNTASKVSRETINDVELSFCMSNLIDRADIKVSLAIKLINKKVLFKVGDILPCGVFLMNVLLDDVVYVHYLDTGSDFAVRSLTLDAFVNVYAIYPLHCVSLNDPFFKASLTPRNHTEYLMKFCATVLDTGHVSSSVLSSTLTQDNRNDEVNLDRDDMDSVDEDSIVDKLITSNSSRKKATRYTSRKIDVDPSNIITVGRSLRTREKPVVDVDLSNEPASRAVKVSDKKKVATPKPQKKRESAGANITKNASIIITDESKSTTDSANRELMKFMTELKKSNDDQNRKQIESANEFKNFCLNEFKVLQKTAAGDEQIDLVKSKVKVPKLRNNNDENEYSSTFDHYEGDPQKSTNHRNYDMCQGPFKIQDRSNKLRSYEDYEVQQPMYSNQRSHDMDRGPLKQRGADRVNQFTSYADYEAQYPTHSEQHNHDMDRGPLKQSGSNRSRQFTSYEDNEAQHQMHSNQRSHNMNRGPLKQSGADFSRQFTSYSPYYDPQQQILSNNHTNGMQQHGADDPYQFSSTDRYADHQQMSSNRRRNDMPPYRDQQHFPSNYHGRQHQMENHHHMYPQSFSVANGREETSSVKKVMILDLMDMVRKMN